MNKEGQSCLQAPKIYLRRGWWVGTILLCSEQLGLPRARVGTATDCGNLLGDLQAWARACICIHLQASLDKAAQVGSERSRVTEPGPGVQVSGWQVPLEEMRLLSAPPPPRGVRTEEEKLLGRRTEKGLRQWRLN